MPRRKCKEIKLKLNKRGFLKVGFPEYFQWYSANYGTIKDKALAKKVITSIFENMWYEMIVNLWVFKWPHSLGRTYIAESTSPESVVLYTDWQASRKKHKKVKAFNAGLNGRKPFVKWVKPAAKYVKHLGLYRFKAYRGNKNELTGHRGMWGHINSLNETTYRPHLI